MTHILPCGRFKCHISTFKVSKKKFKKFEALFINNTNSAMWPFRRGLSIYKIKTCFTKFGLFFSTTSFLPCVITKVECQFFIFYLVEINLWHRHRLLLITNSFIYPFGSFLHHLVTYSNLFNPTSPKLTKLTQKLYIAFPFKSRTLHKHSKPMHTALPQPPSPFFNSFQVLWKFIF
jgi:hypothetical protein